MLRLGLAAQRLLPVQQALRALVQLPHGAPEACAPSTSYSTKPAQNKDVRYTIGNNLDSLVKIVDPYQGPLKLSGWNILANNNAGIMQLEKAAHHFSKKWWTAFMCLRSIKGFTLLGLRANALDAHVAMNEAVARGISEGSMEPELHARLQKQLTQTMYHGLQVGAGGDSSAQRSRLVRHAALLRKGASPSLPLCPPLCCRPCCTQANIANFRRAGWHRVDYKLARDPVIADVEARAWRYA